MIERKTLADYQLRFVQSKARELLLSGAFASAKSYPLCCKLYAHALVPGTRHALVRKTYASLVRTTLKTLIVGHSTLPPVIPPGTYRHIKSGVEPRIEIFGGGVISLMGCDHQDRLGSFEAHTIGVDECADLDEDEWVYLDRAIRLAGMPNQLFGATNPGNPNTHFLYDYFFNPANGGRVVAAKDEYDLESRQRLVITSGIPDNPFLSDEYVKAMSRMTGWRKDRYFFGQWVASEGLVYGQVWDRKRNVCKRDEEWGETIVGCDDGYVHPFVLNKFGVDDDGGMHCIEEVHESGLLHNQKVAAALAMDADLYIVDPSAAALIAAFKEAGLNAVGANNDVLGGIALTADRMREQENGECRLTFDESCVNNIRDFESYSWKKGGKDEVVKEVDDGPDATRYVVNHLDGERINPSVFSMEPEQKKNPDSELRELIETCETDDDKRILIDAIKDAGEWEPREGWKAYELRIFAERQ